MKISVLASAGLVLAGSFAALPAPAQNARPAAKQPVPRVLTAPRPNDTARPQAGERATPRGQREDRGQAPPRPERDPPMPRPVPSIIAP